MGASSEGVEQQTKTRSVAVFLAWMWSKTWQCRRFRTKVVVVTVEQMTSVFPQAIVEAAADESR